MRVWLTEHEAMEYINRSWFTLRHWRHTGRVIHRKRLDKMREYDRDSLTRAAALADFHYYRRVVRHWHRKEAIWLLTECLQNGLPLPDDNGLSRWFDVSHPQARAWRRQWLTTLNKNTWEHTDQQIADRANTTPANVAEARREHESRRRSIHKVQPEWTLFN